MARVPIISGPLQDRPSGIPESIASRNPTMRVKSSSTTWLHHVLTDAGYDYVGPCLEFHDVDYPEFCTVSWDSHYCAEFDPHTVHKCCCGESHVS